VIKNVLVVLSRESWLYSTISPHKSVHTHLQGSSPAGSLCKIVQDINHLT